MDDSSKHEKSVNDGRPPVLAQKNFAQHRAQLHAMNLAACFSYICENNVWGAEASVSGLGSTQTETEVLRREIPALFHRLGVTSVLDLPCGDFCWMRDVDLSGISYIGADIVPVIVAANKAKFSSPTRQFLQLDLTSDRLPSADLILCRDCLVHLSYANIRRALANMQSSGAKWVLMTHFLRIGTNADIPDGDWRPLSFTRPPFDLPEPELAIVEGCKEASDAYEDKALALWRVADLGYVPWGR